MVLGWLRGDPRRFKTFVGNRVSEVLELIPPNAWGHVSGKDNPADCASRGLYPTQLADRRQWWRGPDWLRQPVSLWPATEESPACDATEERTTDPNIVALHISAQDLALPLLSRISTYSRLIRVTAWILRFGYNLRNPAHRNLGALGTNELNQAEQYWLKEIQHSAFSKELRTLRSRKLLPSTSRLITFRPFLDREGLLRVGGRLEHGKFSYAKRHPILFPETTRW